MKGHVKIMHTTASPDQSYALVSDPILKALALPVPAALPRRILALGKLDEVWAQASTRGGPLFDRLLASLGVECACDEDDLHLIPHTGPAILMANHPHGILDGMLAASLAARVRSDVKIVCTSMLSVLPDLADQIIAVDIYRTPSAIARNVKALRQAIRWLKGGGMLLVFPAGAVSRFHPSRMGITDLPWSPHFVALAKRVSAKTIPLFIPGSNSRLFQAMSFVNDGLGTAMLPRELMKQRCSRVTVRIGQPITAQALARFENRRAATEYVRFRAYLLAHRNRRPRVTAAPSAIDVADPIHANLLAGDIQSLPACARLYRTEDYSVYLASAPQIPNVLQEIGRLREVTFRAEGEGTGRAIDLDRFDDYYRHLFVWHNHQQQIVGAYRLGLSEEIIPRWGPWGLYTTTLFRFPNSWWRSVTPAIELGRSFIRLEHQRNYGALLALWHGIGAFLDEHPQYRYLFGPVSISGRYKAASIQLIASYLRPATDHTVTAHTPPHANHRFKRAVEQQPLHVLPLDDLDAMIKDIEPDRSGLPVLLRHYVNLGGRILAFNEDARFSAAVDGLLLIDLLNADVRRLDRFLGKGVIGKIALAALQPCVAA